MRRTGKQPMLFGIIVGAYVSRDSIDCCSRAALKSKVVMHTSKSSSANCFNLYAGRAVARSPMQANLSFLQAEESTASSCGRAWASLRKFESFFPNVTVGAQLDPQYLSNRSQCLALAKQLAESLGLTEALALDATLMLDRLVHQSPDVFSQVTCSCCLFPA